MARDLQEDARDEAYNLGFGHGEKGLPNSNPYGCRHFCYSSYEDGYRDGAAQRRRQSEGVLTAGSMAP